MKRAEIPCDLSDVAIHFKLIQIIQMLNTTLLKWQSQSHTSYKNDIKTKHNKTEEGLLIHYEVSDNKTVISQINAGE